jgi:DNA-binding response OmpR family regulator
MKILIVDDDVELTKALESTITSAGHDAQSANDPKEGLKLIRDQKHDVVFLDLAMPELSGADIIGNLAEDDKIKLKNIVIITASAADDKELQKLIDLGVHSILRKPVDIDALLDKIEEVGSS